jgi:hypothetical protein
MTPAVTACVSSPQKTSSPTFHVPFCKTEVPEAPEATVVPSADRSYFTFALVAEDSVTESTLDVTADANGLDAKAVSAEVYCEPFCSSWTRLLVGVEELKKVFQLVVTSETALAEPPLAAGAELAAAVVGAAADVVGAVEGVEDEELELLEQADIAVTSARPSAGAR